MIITFLFLLMNKQQYVNSQNNLVKDNIFGMKGLAIEEEYGCWEEKYKKLFSEANEAKQSISAISPGKRNSGSLFSHNSTSLTKNGETRYSDPHYLTNKQQQNDLQHLSPMQKSKIRQRTNPKISVLKTIVTANKMEVNPLFSNNIIFSNLQKNKREHTIPKKRSLNSMKLDLNKQLPRIQIGDNYPDIGQQNQVCQLVIQQRSPGINLPSHSSKRSQLKISLSRNKSNSCCQSKITKNKKVVIQSDKRPKLQLHQNKYNYRKKQGNEDALQIQNIIKTDLKFLHGQNAYHFEEFLTKIQKEELCRKVINITKWITFRYSNIEQK